MASFYYGAFDGGRKDTPREVLDPLSTNILDYNRILSRVDCITTGERKFLGRHDIVNVVEMQDREFRCMVGD